KGYPGRGLFPEGCLTLAETVQQYLQQLTPDDLLAFDQRVEQLLRQQFGALVQVCLSSSNSVLKHLQAAMQPAAEPVVTPHIAGADVAELFLSQNPEDDQARSEIAALHAEAMPEGAERAGQGEEPPAETTILLTPPGEAGDRFRDLAQQALSHVTLRCEPSSDDIVLFREKTGLPLTGLEHLGPAAVAA